MRKIALVLGMAWTLVAARAQAVEKIEPDPKAVKLVSDLLAALSQPDDAARIKVVIPLVHKSLLTDDGKDLAKSVKDFSYKKASQSAKLYKQPADVAEVHKGRDTTIGFKGTSETGRVDKYFVKKNEGVAGRAAPVQVFWPKGGGEPKILDMGSL